MLDHAKGRNHMTKRPDRPVFQAISIAALKQPDEGFRDSDNFKQSIALCPRCKRTLWNRMRFQTSTIIGTVCEDCNWMSTYLVKPDQKAPSPQPSLPHVKWTPKPKKERPGLL